LPLATCPFCGSTWFRVVDVNRYLPQAPADWWELDEQEALNRTHPRLRVCLCGAPLKPVVAGGLMRQAIEEVVSFKRSFDGALAEMESSRRDLDAAVKSCLEDPLRQDDPFDAAAAARLRRAEEMVLWEQRKADPKAIFGARKPWKKIDREPEAKTALGRDDLVLALQEKGFTYRMARLLVKVILATLHLKLELDHEMETPVGKFRLAAAPKQREHRAFEHLVKTYTHERWIRFRPAADLTIRALDDAAAAEDEAVLEEEDEDMAQSEEGKPVVKCPRCKSTWMMAAEFRQYMEANGSTPGADIFPLDDGSAFRLRVCLCGQPIGPTLRGGRQDVPGLNDFRANVKKARRYLKRVGAVEEAVERVLLQVAGKQERLLSRLSDVEAAINALRPDDRDGF
jgi:hypothetical protein